MGATQGISKHEQGELEHLLSDVARWCGYLKSRRELRQTGGNSISPAAQMMGQMEFARVLEEACAMSGIISRSHWFGSIKKTDIQNMIDEELDEIERSLAKERVGSHSKNIDTYLQNAILFEGLYQAFPEHAATTSVMPYNERALASVPNRIDCHESPGRITFSEDGFGTLDALRRYASNGLRAVGTNFAHPLRPGGHYEQGSNTQEEDLCRRAPNFWISLVSERASAGFCDESGLNAGFHVDATPTKAHAQLKFTANVHVLRDCRGRPLEPSDQIRVGIVTIAAPCFHPASLGLDQGSHYARMQSDKQAKALARSFLMSDAGALAVKDAMRSMILSPLVADPEAEALVLGAWGCGAYNLAWDLVMAYFRDVIVETGALSKYREIHFPLFERRSCGLGTRFQSIWAEHVKAERITM